MRSTPSRFSRHSCARGAYAQPCGGFALLITITLLAFLVLLLVSIASLTRIETQVATNSQQLSQSRGNALLALNLALGQLQKLAGPDQRTTAAADLGGAGSSLVAPLNGARQWTGVWGNRNAWNATTTKPELLGWLVSGNEETDLKIDTNAATFGRIGEAVTAPIYRPDGELPALTAATTATTDLGDWKLMAGVNTVGATVDRFVVAPRRPISVPTNSLPGFDGAATGNTPIGHYAWWIGDEGIKARVALVDPIGKRADPSERSQSFIIAQRLGIEQVIPEYPANAAELANVLSLRQLPLAGDAAVHSALNEASKDHFHDFTGQAASVLADVSRGGLKKDLTSWFHHGGGPSDADPLIPGTEDVPILPKWGLLRTYADTVDDGEPKSPVAGSDRLQGLSPVITYMRMGYGISRKNDRLTIHVFPALILWNPTNVTLRGDYEVGFGYATSSTARSRNTFTVLTGAGTPVPGKTWTFRARFGGGTANAPFRFKVAATDIPPGRSLLFAIKDSDADAPYAPGANILSPISSPGADPSNSVTLDTGIPLSATEQVSWCDLSDAADINMSRWQSDSLYFILRPPAATAMPPLGEMADSDYQAMQNLGFSTSSNLGLATATVAPACLGPALHTAVRMQMAGTTADATLRWLAHLNPRARQSRRTSMDTSSTQSPLYAGSVSKNSTAVPNTLDGVASAGLSVDYTTPATTKPVDYVLAEFRPQNVPLLSLAQFQHANLSLISAYPAFAVGNAITNPWIPRASTSRETTFIGGAELVLHDLSWQLNRTLWDRYYLSTLPSTVTQTNLDSLAWQLPNARLTLRRPPDVSLAQADFNTAAAFSTNSVRLMVEGGFNVNSTSVSAWRALLAGLHRIPYDPKNPSGTIPPGNGATPYSFTRYAKAIGGVGGDWASPNEDWAGYRALSAGAINGLAQKIVDEVRRRGPFLSLADFINRRVPPEGGPTNEAIVYKGSIQAAIDAYDASLSGANPSDAINRRGIYVSYEAPSSPAHGSGLKEEYWAAPARETPGSSRAAFAPGYLSQADVLTSVGPALAARSDTFLVRAYGDSINPMTGEETGRAWCEATVQRLPDFMSPKIGAAGDLAEAWPPVDPQNRDFGRRFRVVSFRWLTVNDI